MDCKATPFPDTHSDTYFRSFSASRGFVRRHCIGTASRTTHQSNQKVRQGALEEPTQLVPLGSEASVRDEAASASPRADMLSPALAVNLHLMAREVWELLVLRSVLECCGKGYGTVEKKISDVYVNAGCVMVAALSIGMISSALNAY
jgi:hypothetical protein